MRILGTIGDVNPVDHTGGVIVENGYGPQLVWYQSCDHDDGTVTVYRVVIGFDMESDLDWVDWAALDAYTGVHPDEIDKRLSALASPVQKAQVYADAGNYHGWNNLDNEPDVMTRDAAAVHYESMMQQAACAS